MKRFPIFLLLPVLFSTLLFSGCSKDDDDDNNNNNTPATLTSTLTSGTWRITYYWDSGDETSNFTGYNFTFGTGNVVTAIKGTSTVTGTWGTRIDDSKTKLDLAFTSPAIFAELTDDWHVIERTSTRIRLQDVSGGGGGTDLLTFDKN